MVLFIIGDYMRTSEIGRLIQIKQNRKLETPYQNIGLAIEANMCQRCVSQIDESWQLPSGMSYCWNCAVVGRLTEQDALGTLNRGIHDGFERPIGYYTWNGQLTEVQSRLVMKIIDGFQLGKDQLLHAVTGAGKTEMIYPILKKYLDLDYRVAYVSPRIEVIRELAPRIMANFHIEYAMLHGELKDNKQWTQLLFATTHQMYKFYRAFDLIIVDEADAFPFKENRSLWYALAQARSDKSRIIYMTATLSTDLKWLIKMKQVQLQQLFCRYHGFKIPNLQLILIQNDWRQQLPQHMIRQLQEHTGPWLIFVPKIADLDAIAQQVEKYLPHCRMQCISSQTNQKEGIVDELKQNKLDIICTTIILERGITISNVQIIILDADEGIYTDESLIQIAGRSGRDARYPYGNIFVYCFERTKQLMKVIEAIDQLNAK